MASIEKIAPSGTDADAAAAPSETLADLYHRVRVFSERLCAPLKTEDYVVQSMPDVSPAKWHLAHTTWFFETFILRERAEGYEPFHPQYAFLFNSYYNAIGAQFSRPNRGLLTRPTVEEIYRYREYVDECMLQYLHQAEGDESAGTHRASLRDLVLTGLHHEQQHQELILTDIKHVLSCNPLLPAYQASRDSVTPSRSPLTALGKGQSHVEEKGEANPGALVRWHEFEGGEVSIGHEGDAFCYDNETPRHRVLLEPFALASRLVTCGEYLQFIEDGGYRRPTLWLSDAWSTLAQERWKAPLYWQRDDQGWKLFTLSGLREIDPGEPVAHISYYEADAFARWAGARLPTETEWETAAGQTSLTGNFVESGVLHPRPTAGADQALQQMFGDVWEWTASPYTAYPGYRPAEGALGEYNGKFMCNQMVLRGGSCATSRDHIRATYRNFFPPAARWQFSGFRLAKDAR